MLKTMIGIKDSVKIQKIEDQTKFGMIYLLDICNLNLKNKK